MEIKGLQGKDICAIIKTCANAGVSEFSAGGLVVKFGKAPEKVGIPTPNEGTHLTPPQSGETDEQIPELQMDILQQRAVEDLANAQTLIDSPLQFEDDLVDDMIFGENVNDSEERRRVRKAI